MTNLSEAEVASRRAEFNAFVWNHAADAFQARFDTCAALTDHELIPLMNILAPENLRHADALATAVRVGVLRDGPALLRRLLQLAGLTRNKILQDIKGYAREQGLVIPLSTLESLFNHHRGVLLGSEYLAAQLMRVFAGAGEVTAQTLEVLNQATWPGYIRQERAKRMGHEAEYRLACILRDCGIPFEPVEKAENPLCRDVQIGGMSYDLVSPTTRDARLRVVATVHTANIGQYGESKDDLEIRKALAAIAAEGARDVTLLAMIDGVGFESNIAGLTGVLQNAHEFCQFRTIWKAAVIAAHKCGWRTQVALPSDQHRYFAPFCAKHGAQLCSSNGFDGPPEGAVVAGDAYIRVIR